MAEQVFKSPGFFENEVDLSQREEQIQGVPAGVVGTAEMGPAFVPVTIGSFVDFQRRFGNLSSTRYGPYAVREFLKHRTALTYIRVLGAGANTTSGEIEITKALGTVKGAGFKIIGEAKTGGPHEPFQGTVQFLVGRHHVSASHETRGMPMFSDNDSFNVTSGDDNIFLVRGMIMNATGTNIQILDYNQNYSNANVADDVAYVGLGSQTDGLAGKFKIVISSSAGSAFAADEGHAGIKIVTASYDPSDEAYIGKVLNTDPLQFQTKQYLLYTHFPVDNEIATIDDSGANGPAIAIASGSLADGSRVKLLDNFGRFDTRYRPAQTTKFISQPFGKREFDLFHFEAISDGSVGNDKFKISIANIRKNADPTNSYGTFTVLVRSFNDTDLAQQILEQYPNCTLDPTDDSYVAKKVGDYKVQYDFDATRERERRLGVTGKNPNISSRIRIVMSNEMERGEVPAEALPFGFRGIGCVKTTDSLTDSLTRLLKGTYATVGSTTADTSTLAGRISFRSGSDIADSPDTAPMSGSILPPVPFRFKCTRGAISTDGGLAGNPGQLELSDSRLYWGCKFTRTPLTASLTDAVLNANISSTHNEIFKNLVKFSGLKGLDVLVSGSAVDEFNNNKFSLARVCLGTYLEGSVNTVTKAVETYLTGTANDHIRESVYIRNGRPDAGNEYVVSDGTQTQIVTLGSLASLTSSVYFNKFAEYNKFTNFLHGGFDGLNILDRNMAAMNDRATSGDSGGLASRATPAANTALDIGLSSENNFGKGPDNATVRSYRSAVDIMTDPMVSRINMLTVPGIRDTAVTDFVLDEISSYGKAIYLMDMASYDSDNNRVFENDGRRAAVDKTINEFSSRAVDSNYSATYFPDVVIDDPLNNTRVPVPASVAALGAIGYSDAISFPWFAPAGFSRGALDFVKNVGIRLKAKDRDDLYEARINPIATFPNAGFVIFGQKTLQFNKSALDRVNVRRMLLDVKRQVVEVAEALLFEPNNPETRARFISQVTPRLALVQSQQGIDQFKIVMDASNNSTEDIEQNRLNGRIVLVPTRAVEFIVMDFIITNSGVDFD